jgi:hypothetical protein
MDNGSPLGSSVTLSGGVATYSTAALAGGAHTITASYSGDTNFLGSTSSAFSQQVNQAATTITLSSNGNPSAFGQTVVFTATVSPAGATGTVQFMDNSNPLGSPVTLSGGVATYSTAGLTVGSHTITASYSGDTNFLGSTSSTLGQEVTATGNITTSTSLTVPPLGIGFHQRLPAVFSVAVTASNGATPSGSVILYEGDKVLATMPPLDGSGSSSLAFHQLRPGGHNIRALYLGDNTNNLHSSASTPETVYVSPRPYLH